MSKVSEIKCPVCEKWSNWTEKIDERCPNCDAQYDPGRVQYAEEKRNTTERIQKDSYFITTDTDDPVVRIFKEFANWLRWATFYGISAIYFVIAIMIIVYGLVMI